MGGGGGGSHQGVEGGDGEDPQTSQHALGGPAGGGQQALGVGELAALQAGLVTAQLEELQVELLQVLLPLLDLGGGGTQETRHHLQVQGCDFYISEQWVPG